MTDNTVPSPVAEKRSLDAPAGEPVLWFEECPGCDYALTALPIAGICPECGRQYDRREIWLPAWTAQFTNNAFGIGRYFWVRWIWATGYGAFMGMIIWTTSHNSLLAAALVAAISGPAVIGLIWFSGSKSPLRLVANERGIVVAQTKPIPWWLQWPPVLCAFGYLVLGDFLEPSGGMRVNRHQYTFWVWGILAVVFAVLFLRGLRQKRITHSIVLPNENAAGCVLAVTWASGPTVTVNARPNYEQIYIHVAAAKGALQKFLVNGDSRVMVRLQQRFFDWKTAKKSSH